jgi:hypothetical protein
LNGTNTVTGKTQFNADVSFNSNTTFNNTSTQISSSGVVGISGGIVNISGGVINLNGTLNHSGGDIITNGSQSRRFTSTGDSRFTSPDTFTTYINNDKTGGDVRINTGSYGSNVIVDYGNVGIGIYNPSEKLEVYGHIRLRQQDAFVYQGIPNSDLGSLSLQAGYSQNAQNTTKIVINGLQNNETSGTLLFCTIGAERMRVHSNGNVGIGTTNPGSKLHVVGNVNMTGTLTVNSLLTIDTNKLYKGSITPTLCLYFINDDNALGTSYIGPSPAKTEVSFFYNANAYTTFWSDQSAELPSPTYFRLIICGGLRIHTIDIGLTWTANIFQNGSVRIDNGNVTGSSGNLNRGGMGIVVTPWYTINSLTSHIIIQQVSNSVGGAATNTAYPLYIKSVHIQYKY